MFATKLSRFTGLVFVLAAVFGGAGAYEIGAEHGTGGSSTVAEVEAVSSMKTLKPPTAAAFDFDWS